MAKLLKLRLGVADDPTALQPTLNDCLEAMLQQADLLMTDVLHGLTLATSASGARRVAGFQKGANKQAIDGLNAASKAVCKTYKDELTSVVYQGGGKEQVQTELLRFEDLQLFEDAELDQSIEVARAQQEVSLAVDDVLGTLDGLVSTLLGWRTVQPGLNPLRPEVFVRALQATLAKHVPDPGVREALIVPAAGLLGANLRKLYREMADWLLSTGVEPAVPMGGKLDKNSTGRAAVNNATAKTLLTLDKLRKLLAGDFDAPKPRGEFLHTVPASMALLQEMKAVDTLVKRLEQRPAPVAPPAPQTLEEQDAQAKESPPPRIGQQLGEEVVRLMFDNLTSDTRLLGPLKSELRAMEPAILKMAQADSRFFSDRNHPARQVLDRITQRSLAFASESDPGWPRFLQAVQSCTAWLGSKVVDSETFGELIEQLQKQWGDQDQGLRQRREEAARALLHAEQRNLLAQKLGAEFMQQLEGLDVADFVADFLKNSWSQVVAEAQLSCVDGSDDPYGYRAMVEDLIWSVQKTTAQRGRQRRLVQMIPGLLHTLREGLHRIHYPPELTQRFFDNLITIHRAAVQEKPDPQAVAAAEAAEAEVSRMDMEAAEAAMWMAQNEVTDSGYLEADSFMPPDAAEPQPEPPAAKKPARSLFAEPAEEVEVEEITPEQFAAAEREVAEREVAEREAAEAARREAEEADKRAAEEAAEASQAEAAAPAQPEAVLQLRPAAEEMQAAAPESAAAAAAEESAGPVGAADLRTGTWVELSVNKTWTRMQLTWASPHGTLFMFTSLAGSAHSMSRRTLERLRADGTIRIVAERNVVDEALDQVAKAALKNSLDNKG